MKTSSASATARTTLAALLLLAGLCLLGLTFSNVLVTHRAHAAADAPNLTEPVSFSGTYHLAAYPCNSPRHKFTVPAGEARIIVYVQTTLPTNDITVTLLRTALPDPEVLVLRHDTATGSELLVYEPGGTLPAG